MRRAGFWRRAVALAIDALAASVLGSILGLAAYFLLADGGRPELGHYAHDLIAVAVMLLYTSSEVWARRSPGKLLLGMVITYPDGSAADRWTLFLRWSTKFSPYLIALVSVVALRPVLLEYLGGWMSLVILVGCLQGLDERKRAWHDEWARTAVFRRNRGAAPPDSARGAVSG